MRLPLIIQGPLIWPPVLKSIFLFLPVFICFSYYSTVQPGDATPAFEYTKLLNEKKIKHELFISDGGHTWMNCKLYLAT